MTDIVILYEHKQRELDNACLLKYVLEKKGYKVKIYNLYNMYYPDIIQPFYFEKPRLVIVPWLYGDDELDKVRSLFNNHSFKILNLQCEQVLSERWIENGYHFPKKAAQTLPHICWGKEIKERLLKLDIKNENLFLTGAISTDFDRREFHSLFKSKNELANEFDLEINKKWLLFISSFTFTTMSSDEIEELVKRTKINNSDFIKVMVSSKKVIIDWLLTFAKEHEDYEIIYRPHPNEKNDTEFQSLIANQSNFRLIGDYSVGQWIRCSEYVNTWISTSIVDAYFMGKKYCVLRPISVDRKDDSELFSNSTTIGTYEEFHKFNSGDERKSNYDNIPKYYLRTEHLVCFEIADKVEEMLTSPIYSLFHGTKAVRIKYLKSMIIYLSYYSNFFIKLTHNRILMEVSKETLGSKKYVKDFTKRLDYIFKDNFK